MKYESWKLYQGNMFCSKCLMCIAVLLSKLTAVKWFGVDLDSRTVTVKIHKGFISRKLLRTLINEALTYGFTPSLPGAASA